ncbi:MAG: Uma2 family endonuclease [Gemmataceae bacterium]|nr:Uma2 family endonuclease [Gemmataceae bacterium]
MNTATRPEAARPRADGRRPRRYDPTAPEPEFTFEVVDGLVVRKPVGAKEFDIATRLHNALIPVLAASGFGRSYPGLGYALPGGRGRKPDVSVLSFARWADGHLFPPGDFVPVVPELAVEVISPREKTHATLAKVQEYFAAGVSAVWLVFPNIQQVYCYDSPTAVRVLSRADELAGDPVVPGFRLAVADLFPPAAPTP